ncbi:hypothetical protein IAE37_001916 [Pseudomonas sp. S31]|uniref:DUF6124 family protein n=1 Tax=Pseudomonas sp. S31 TaxID=1564473 RepID=UPI001912385A|nr:hypothetical protein [Pseudomonas sp. S31]MBK4999640.1 hypothetical protein [Pseudomonas sp. S31]
MKPPKKPVTESESDAARRALDYYLNPAQPLSTIQHKIWTLNEDVSHEEIMANAIALLRCAAASAHATAAHQEGNPRELTMALVHMIEMAKALLEHAEQPEPRGAERTFEGKER